jgi:Antibiotic biosynthesis monooxygenase
LAFGVYRSIDHPDEFWLYETWTSAEAVQAHESGAAFQRYKEALRPLVDPGSVLFGNCVPVKVLGYSIEPPAAGSASPREP